MITEERAGSIRILTISDPDALTQHTPDAGRELTERLLAAAEPDAAKAIVLRISGDACEPAAWTPEQALASAQSARQRIYTGTTGLYQSLALCKKPVVAELSGVCRGVASLVALYADLAVADSDAQFYSPFDALPEANFVLAALTIRLDRAKAWVLSGEPMDATTAEEVGLINQVVSRDTLSIAALNLARRIVKMPLDGITVSKMNLNACLDAMAVGEEFDLAGYFAAGFATPGVLGIA